MRVIPWIGAALAAIALTGAGRPEEVAVFAGGCFWGVESVFEHVRGVRIAESGYAGGTLASPSYEQVSTGTTGHAESVRVVFDPSVVSYRQLLEIFFAVAHDPTSRDRQANAAKNARRQLAVNPLVPAPYRILARSTEELGERHEAIAAYAEQMADLDLDPYLESAAIDHLVKTGKRPK